MRILEGILFNDDCFRYCTHLKGKVQGDCAAGLNLNPLVFRVLKPSQACPDSIGARGNVRTVLSLVVAHNLPDKVASFVQDGNRRAGNCRPALIIHNTCDRCLSA